MNHLSRFLLVIVVVLTTAVATTAPAAGDGYGDSRTAGHWTAREATAPSGGDADTLQFFDTECPTASTCVSVGIDDGPIGRSIVAGHETAVRVPLPNDRMGFSGDFTLLSCASATFCVGAGDYVANDPTFATFFASWDGTTWRTVRAPAPVPSDDPYGELQALSCGAPGRCTAVSFGTVYTLADGRWTASAPPLPVGTDNPRLSGVSCPSATSCVITGTADAGSGIAPIVLVRHSAATTSLRLPNPPGWTGGRFGPYLLGLDCAAPGHCVIVAGDQDQPRYLVSVDGTRAVYHRVPIPADGERNPFVGRDAKAVSCPTVTSCWVLDSYRLRGSPEFSEPVAVALRLQDGAVGVSVLPEPAPRRDARSEITDLDCPSATSCVAVGSRRTDDGDPPYREAVAVSLLRGVGRATLVPVPRGAPSPRAYELTDVACGAPARCTADGGYQWDRQDGDDDFSFAERRAVLARLIPRPPTAQAGSVFASPSTAAASCGTYRSRTYGMLSGVTKLCAT